MKSPLGERALWEWGTSFTGRGTTGSDAVDFSELLMEVRRPDSRGYSPAIYLSCVRPRWSTLRQYNLTRIAFTAANITAR